MILPEIAGSSSAKPYLSSGSLCAAAALPDSSRAPRRQAPAPALARDSIIPAALRQTTSNRARARSHSRLRGHSSLTGSSSSSSALAQL
jgi:hypothetical protein